VKDSLKDGDENELRRLRAETQTRDDVLLDQLTGNAGPAPGGRSERRRRGEDRRKRHVWGFIYGMFHPRRRKHRRDRDTHHWRMDWHDSGLLYLALAIVLMSCTDALFTLNILALGGEEVNLFMKKMIEQDVNKFLSTKIALTCGGVVVLVAASRYHLLGVVPVRRILQLICVGYGVLIAHELILLSPFIEDTLQL